MVSFESINTVNNTVNPPVFMPVETTADPAVETTDITKQKLNKTMIKKDIKNEINKNREAVAGDGQKNSGQDEQPVAKRN